MPRKLYLHIGAHRTATTSLQTYLRRNRENLMHKGFFHPFGVTRHVALMNELFSGTRSVADAAKHIIALADSKEPEIDAVILSDEDICTRPDLSLLTEFGARFDVKVVFAMRRQDLWLESWYLQNVKWQWNAKLAHLPLDAFLERRDDFFWIRYDSYVRRLEQTFGAENVLLYVFEPERMPAGPIAAFCDLVGLTDRSGFTEEPHSNPSFRPVVSEFMRCLPLDEALDPIRARFERACATVDREIAGKGPRSQPLLIPHDRRRALMAEYDPGNRALARRRLGAEALFLEPLPPADAPVQALALPQDSYALMRELVAPFVRALIEIETEARIKAR